MSWIGLLQHKTILQAKLKEWRDSYQAMKDKMIGNKQKGKQAQNKFKSKAKGDKKQSTKRDETKPSTQNKSKRKAQEEKQGGSEVRYLRLRCTYVNSYYTRNKCEYPTRMFHCSLLFTSK